MSLFAVRSPAPKHHHTGLLPSTHRMVGGASGHHAAPDAVAAPAAGGRGGKSLWLDAWTDPVAGISAYSPCIHT